MARYFFHIEHQAFDADDEGIELPDHHAARAEAARVLGEMLRDNAHDFWSQKMLRLVVTDAAGFILFALDLSGIEAPAISRQRLRTA